MFMSRQESFTIARPVPPVARPVSEPASRPDEGVLAGTLVETVTGWLPIERLSAGDEIYTHDGGLRPIRALRRHSVGPCPRILISGGVLGNDQSLSLPAGQQVLVDGPALETLFDLPVAVARVGDLVGHEGIRALEPAGRADLWQLMFDEEELVWAAGAMRLYCPAHDPARDRFFETLSPAQARLYALSMRTTSGINALAA